MQETEPAIEVQDDGAGKELGNEDLIEGAVTNPLLGEAARVARALISPFWIILGLVILVLILLQVWLLF